MKKSFLIPTVLGVLAIPIGIQAYGYFRLAHECRNEVPGLLEQLRSGWDTYYDSAGRLSGGERHDFTSQMTDIDNQTRVLVKKCRSIGIDPYTR